MSNVLSRFQFDLFSASQRDVRLTCYQAWQAAITTPDRPDTTDTVDTDEPDNKTDRHGKTMWISIGQLYVSSMN